MSWDILIQHMPPVASLADVPESYHPPSLGQRNAVIDAIRGAVPGSDFSDPAWGSHDGGLWSIEFNIGEDEICDAVMLHVRGIGDGAVVAIAAILKATGARAIDCQTGQFYDHETALESFETWAAYRDRVAADYASPPRRGWFARLFGR